MTKAITAAFWGFVGAVSLSTLYVGILTFVNSAAHAWQQFLLFWPWMTLLVFGFGMQVGLFSYLRMYKRAASLSAGPVGTASVAATGGVSAGSMVACCLHHTTDVLPLLGLSAAAVFVSRYQPLFLAVGIVSNLVGITFMLKTMQKHTLYFKGGAAEKLMRWDMGKVFMGTLITGMFALAVLLGVLLWE